MKYAKNLLAMLVITSLFGCKKESIITPSPIYGCTDPTSTNYNPYATASDGSCKYEGNATFWYNSGGTNAAVVISTPYGNVTENINGNYYYTTTPSCGANYCANFTLPIGTYTWAAASTYHTWSGTITVTKNNCSTMLLH